MRDHLLSRHHTVLLILHVANQLSTLRFLASKQTKIANNALMNAAVSNTRHNIKHCCGNQHCLQLSLSFCHLMEKGALCNFGHTMYDTAKSSESHTTVTWESAGHILRELEDHGYLPNDEGIKATFSCIKYLLICCFCFYRQGVRRAGE